MDDFGGQISTKDDLKRQICEMVEGIDSYWILKQIYRCIVNITKED